MNNAGSSSVMFMEPTRKATVNEIKIELSLTMYRIMGSHTTIIVYNPVQGPGYSYSYECTLDVLSLLIIIWVLTH